MAKSKRGLIFLTCFTSGLAAALSLLSLGTQQWIISEAKWYAEGNSGNINKVHYGLFLGVLEYKLGAVTNYELVMTCNFGENSCAMLCGATAESRGKELEMLINNEDVKFNVNCPRVLRTVSTSPFEFRTTKEDDRRSPIFINAGVYICTIICLVISAALGLFSAFLAVWNTGGNPIHTVFSIYGMQYYNSIAAGLIALVIIMWSSFFATNLVKNISILHTISGKMTSDGLADLGYSFWVNLGSLILYIISACVLFLRQFLINREPQVKLDIEDVNNDIILF